MEYTIKKSRLLETMKDYMLDKIPELKFPLKEKGINTFDYNDVDNTVNTIVYQDKESYSWFKKFDDMDSYQMSKWEVSDRLEFLYELFGEELFVDLIMNYFGLDIRFKGEKKYDWLFR
jgi:hypothetical protein